jgi:hypothetical protein
MKKINYEVRESTDGACPYCGSSFVMEVSDEEADAVRERISAGSCKIFKCYTCNKYFFIKT